MNTPKQFSKPQRLSVGGIKAAEAVCDAFEHAWQTELKPQIEDYLSSIDEKHREVVFSELLELDRYYREQRSDSLTLTAYVQRFPQFRDLIHACFHDATTVNQFSGSELKDTINTINERMPELRDYEILEELGRGGMGVVYKARHEKLKRLVALKVILAGEHTGTEQIARFRSEAEAVARLQHANIVQIFEIGEHNGLPYLALEFVDGGNLGSRLHGTPLPSRQVALIVQDLASAVQYSHEQGVIHRDLKPANVLLTSDTFVPKITDFGLAKLLDADTTHTQSGAVMGSPSYMAPEQAAGRVHKIGPATDVYALGAILYELLTGRPPFKAASVMETLKQVLGQEPVSPRTLNPAVDRDLETICLKCLQKDAGKRYDTARGFRQDLTRYLDNQPILARPISRPARLWRWCKRNPLGATVVGLLACLAVAGPAVAIYQAEMNHRLDNARAAAAERAEGERLANLDAQEKKKLAIAAAAKEKAARLEEQRQRKFAEAISQFVKNDFLGLTSVEGQERFGGTDAEVLSKDTTLRQLLDRAAAKLRARQDLDPRIEAELCWIIGVNYRAWDAPGRGVPFLKRAVHLRRQLLGQDHQETLNAMNSLAVGYGVSGQLDKALPLFEQTLKLAKAKLGVDDPDTLRIMNNLADAYREGGQLDKGLPLFEQTLKLMKAKLGTDHPHTLGSMGNLAEAYNEAGQLNKALPLFEQTLKLMKAKLGADHLYTLGSMNNLARGYLAAGHLDRALPLFEQTLKFRKAKLGPDHPHTLGSMGNLAEAYNEAGQLNKALPLFEQTLKLMKAKLGTDHPDTLNTMNNLASGYRAAGKLDLALPLFEQTLKLRKAKLGPGHPSTLTSMNNLAAGYWRAKRLDKSVPLFEKTLKFSAQKLGRNHPDTQLAVANLGVNYRDAGRLSEALPLLEEAHKASHTIPRLRWVGNQLLFAYKKAGKTVEAEALAKELQDLDKKRSPKNGVAALTQKASALFRTGAFAQAEPLLRQALALAQQKEPERWTTFQTQALLGQCLLGRKNYREAEPLLLQGYQGMKKRAAQIPVRQRDLRLQQGMGLLAQLFEATRDKDESKLQGKLTDAKPQAVHEIKLTAGHAVVILMNSGRFDTLLRIQDAKGKLLVTNDDIDYAAKKTNSRIWFVPPADGDYRIIAASYRGAGRGDYEIVIRRYGKEKR